MIVSFAAYQRVTDRQTDGRTDTPPVAKTLDQCHLLAQFSATKMLKKILGKNMYCIWFTDNNFR